MDFNIGILSTLEIDSQKSAHNINRKIHEKEFRDRLLAVQMRLEASTYQADTRSFINSVDSFLATVKDKFPALQVTLDVNVGESVNTINSSLEEIQSHLKSIKVDVITEDDKSTTTRDSTKPSTSSTGARRNLELEKEITNEKAKQRGHTSGINSELGKTVGETSKLRADTDEVARSFETVDDVVEDINESAVKLKSQFTSVEDLVESMERQFSEAGHEIDSNNTKITNLKNDMSSVVVQVERYNEELRKSQTLTVRAEQDATGMIRPTSVTQNDSTQKRMNESARDATKAIDRQIQAYRQLIANDSPVEQMYRRQIASLERLKTARDLDRVTVNRAIEAQKIAVIREKRTSDARKLQIKLLDQHTAAMQRNHRFINRSGMKVLRSQIEGVNLQSTQAITNLRSAQLTMQGFVNNASQATRSQMGLIENFNNAMVKFPIWMGASTLFFGAVRSARNFLTTIIDIDSQLITLQKVMSDTANMDEVFNNARISAERYGQTLNDVLDAYAEFARQGYEGTDLANFGNAALITANVGEMSAQQASEFLTAAAAQWQTDSQQAMGNIDEWNEIANNYATTVEKLGEGQAKAGATAKAMGLSFSETNAIIGALTAQTKQSGSEIGNFIKSAFPRMYAGAGRGVFEQLGISMETASGETKNAITLLREAAHEMENLSQAEQADAIRGLGGVWHYQRMQVLLETLRDANGLYDQMLHSAENSTGSAAAENAVYMESLEARMNKARVAIEELGLAIGEAFLEAGMIEFITTATSALEQLSRVFTEWGSAARGLGLAGVVMSLSLMSKSARNLYSDLNILIARGWSRLSQATNTQTIATQANTAAEQAAGKVRTTNAAIDGRRLVLSRQMVGANKSLTTSQTALGASNQYLTTTSQAAGVATTFLGNAIRGLMIATGVGAVVAGLTWAIENLLSRSAAATNQLNTFRQTTDVLKQSLETDARRVHELSDSYENLSRTIASGDYNNDQLQEHRRVTEELAMLFPDLVSGNEEYGTSLDNTSGLIEQRIEMVERQIEAERELSRVQRESQLRDEVDAGKKAERDIEKEINKAVAQTWQEVPSSITQFVNKFPEELREGLEDALLNGLESIEDYNEAMEKVAKIREEFMSSEPPANTTAHTAYQRNLESLNDIYEKLEEHHLELQQSNMEVMTGMSAVAQVAMADFTRLIDSTSALGNGTELMFGDMINSITSFGLSIGETEEIFQGMFSTLSQNTEFQDQLKEYEYALERLSNATTDEGRFNAIQDIDEAFGSLTVTIKEFLDAQGLTEEQINTVIASLDGQVEGLTGVNTSMRDGTIEDYIAHQNALEEATDGATDALDAQAEAVKGLVDAFKELDGEMDTISTAMNQLAETGYLETDTVYKLLEMYPELLGQQLTAAEMQDFLTDKYNEANAEKINLYQKELLANEETMQGIIDNEDHKLHEVAAKYGIDLKNFNTIEEAKDEIARLFNQGTVEQQAIVVNALGDRYGIDLDNYETLAEKKAAIEAQLMTMIIEVWNDHIEQLMALSPELEEYLKNYKGVDGLKSAQQRVNAHFDHQGHSILAENAENAEKYDKAMSGLHKTLQGIKPLQQDLLSIDFGTSNLELQKAISGDDLFNDLTASKSASDILGSSLEELANSGDVLGSSMRGAGDKSKAALEETGKAAQDAKEELEGLHLTVQQQIRTFQKQTFVLNEHEESLRKINLQIEKQNLQTQRYASHSASYRRALQAENRLNEQKLKVMQAQEKSLEQQIKSGKIQQYGMVSEDINVAYNQYSVVGSGSSGTGRRPEEGQVYVADGSGNISPFSGMKVNYQHSPQGGGRYARNVGFNGGRHYGIDFGGQSGQAIHTPHGGEVVRAGYDRAMGNYVQIYNRAMDRTFTFMHMLSDLAVKTGQTIQAGSRVGSMGNTGQSTGTHLHFEVSAGRGLSSARNVDPNAYLTSNDRSWIGNMAGATKTQSPYQAGQQISQDTAAYLNAIEQAQLEAIQRSIDEHNAGQQNKSDVHDAKVRLDQMMLERLQLMATMRENDFKIIESYIESYDVNQNILNHKIAELEYQADNAARLAGQTSDSSEWRKFMEKAQDEREKQLDFQEQQVDYISQVLANDAARPASSRMNEVHRFQLEAALRDAREQVVGLKRNIDDAESALLASRTNQMIAELDDQLDDIDKKLTLVAHRRQFFNTENDEGAKQAIANIREEIEEQAKRERLLRESIASLTEYRKELKEQPDLYQQVTDKIEDMENGILNSESATHSLNEEIKSLEEAILTRRVDEVFENLNKNLERAQRNAERFRDELHYIDQEYQPDLYANKQADILLEMQDYRQVIADNIRELQELEKEVKDLPELHKRVTDELKNWEDQQKQVRQEMHSMRLDFAKSFIDSVKRIYSEQQRLAVEAIDKEYSEYEKMIQKKIDLIDKQNQEETYNEDVLDRQEAIMELRNEIAQRMGDDSLSNQRALKELREELRDAEKDYKKFVADRERERRKEALQQELDDAKAIADDKRENTEQIFEDLLNDQRKFNEIQENIMQGQIDKYKEIYEELTSFVGDNVKDIGKSISEGMLDGINTSFDALVELSELLTHISETDIEVPISSLRPVGSNVGSMVTDWIKGVSNQLLAINNSPSLPELNTNNNTSNVTTNHNRFEALVNIENWRGTQKEKNEFVNFIDTELRKRGLV